MKTKHPLFKVWSHIKSVCKETNDSDPSHKYYGAKGIRLCKSWRGSFDTFLIWANCNGYRPGLHLRRIDTKKGYKPSNCVFSTQRGVAPKKYNPWGLGELSLKEAIKKYSTVSCRQVQYRMLKLHWDIEKALSVPPYGKDKTLL